MRVIHIKQLRKKAVSEVKIYILKKNTSASTQLRFKSKATEGEKAVSEVVGNFLK